MPDETNGEGAPGDEPAAPPPSEATGETPPPPAPDQGSDAPPADAEKPKPAPKAKAEAEPPAKQPPPPGGIADLFKEALPDLQFEAYQGLSDVIIELKREDIPAVMPVAKDDARLDLKFLRCLFAVDLEAEGLEVVYQLMSLQKGHDVVLKTRLPQDDPKVASVAELWKAADWHERETRDMFGITFEGHPHLVPLLLPEDMTDHFPLRKDNPLSSIEEWQGELAGEADGGDGEAEE
jgi:NADH-quinone oxidoreductase subunit C